MLNQDDILSSALVDKGTTVLRYDERDGVYRAAWLKDSVHPDLHNLLFASPVMYAMLVRQRDAMQRAEAAFKKYGLTELEAEFNGLAESLRITMLIATEGLQNAADTLKQHQLLKATETTGKAN